MQKSELSFWIKDLLTHPPYSCSEPAFVHVRQDVTRERIIQIVDANEDGRELLHGACCEYLQHEDVRHIVCAPTCLFVIGTSADIAVVEPLLKHPQDFVCKAAKTCLFEIRRRV